ncbi:MAG: biotin--[acetyl-CoA-carboxylase] ligase [Syntrophales bacterium]|jgi:BirA family biotin operon repressor/biotin-[acetyl-CoA-carboxylase] ligase|nr:biotin--[acetyl-CoA-carboxylase] ligase [Syntrophales bacterium]MCK9527597.1 biotin--[acetyl-CoA-carboxylase] ligase [Syntrophales bacterium]MDX9922214.1 biotin--[acetyl-CoA-carboxylase] ligase [Syntrophales bacterium]
MDSSSIAALEKQCSGRLIGRKIHFRETVDSTNTLALKLAGEGAAEGELVLADHQLSGRGRIPGRAWQSPPGRNIYFSVILRPEFNPARAPSITIMAGVAVARVLAEYCPGAVRLKWPNDVQVQGRKVAGILTEMRVTGNRIDCIIIGIGINILMTREEFDESIRDGAISLREAATGQVIREEVALKMFRSLEDWYIRYRDDGFPPIRKEWLSFSGIMGKYVEVINRKTREAGTVIGIDEEGCLLLRDGGGGVNRIFAGDVLVP